jgi:hypothetical protein
MIRQALSAEQAAAIVRDGDKARKSFVEEYAETVVYHYELITVQPAGRV